MSKIAQYLNEHILGDVTTDIAVRKEFATDASIVTAKPDLVVYPRAVSDIRKVVRFTYQLAEKGHVIGITPRGSGSNMTGAAVGKGITLATRAHMNRIFEFDAKQRLVRLQPGVTCLALNESLKLQGYYLPAVPAHTPDSSIGGAIANGIVGASGPQSSAILDHTEELEVVLANGDVIQTRRLSKRELAKKMTQTDFEGQIYRALDNLIEENQQLIDTIDQTAFDASGYASIARVKQKNGSFDLTPLFVGSQGTLGVVSEMIMKVDFYGDEQIMVAAAFSSQQALHDVFDDVCKLSPEQVSVIDGKLVAAAHEKGYQHELLTSAKAEKSRVAGVLRCTFSDFNERTRKRKAKKCQKLFEKFGATAVHMSESQAELDEIAALDGVVYSALRTTTTESIASPFFTGVYIPPERCDEFIGALHKLELQYTVTFPYAGDVVRSIYDFYPQFTYRTVQERQKMLKVYDMFAGLVAAHGGSIVATAGEGRVKSPFVRKQWSPELTKLYDAIRDIFDPYGTLNPGVKQTTELREIVGLLRPAYSNHTNSTYAR